MPEVEVLVQEVVVYHDASYNGPVIVVHYRDDKPLSETPAHSFGPYMNVAEARADMEHSDDCYKVVMDLLIPEHVVKRILTLNTRQN